MNVVQLGPGSRSLGVCAMVNCPLCMAPKRYLLVHVDDGLLKVFYTVRCETCGCTRDVPDHENDAALRAVGLYARLDRRELSSFHYGVEFAALGFATVVSLDKEGETWRCGSCDEKSPENFAECWKCGVARDGYEEAVNKADNSPPPSLPRSSRIDNPDFPWEG